MQSDLRSIEQVEPMADYVRSGGVWTLENIASYSESKGLRAAPTIQIARFPDGQEMIHDGHHRCVGTWIGGRTFLYPSEFRILNWKYEDYLEINPANKWVTPFDPRTHIRKAEFFSYKNHVLEMFKIDPDRAKNFVLNSSGAYMVDRHIHYLPELVEYIKCPRQNSL